MSIKKHFAVLFVVTGTCLLAATARAQVIFQFMPVMNGQTVNGLFSAQLQNTGTLAYNGKIKITVHDGNNKTVLVAVTPQMLVRHGGTFINTVASQTRIQFGNSPAASIAGQTGRFPEGDYEYCFEFTGIENKAGSDEKVFENCFNYSIQPLIPLSLVYPADGDAICNTRPDFTWQPAMPVNRSLRYRLMLAEKKNRQPDADALLNNVPVFQQDNIAGFRLAYPPQVAALLQDREYVWQVIAYENNIKIVQSEIWEFSTKCDDRKPDSSKESYRRLSSSLNGNFYMAGGTLRVAITNPYNRQKMDYTITGLSDPVKKIDNLPAVKVETGLNKIDIILQDIKGLEINKMYLLTIRNIGNQPVYLRFIYKGDEPQ